MKPPHACYYLENKSYFLPPPADGFATEEPLTTPCWCLRTHEATGPDGEHVCSERCNAERPCYRPEVEI
ncbi:MAG: hypothetical protein AB7N76_35705 [Planctomycetota bacterium]